MSVRLCAAAERLPRLVRRKVAILRAFTVVLLKSFKSCLLFAVALPGLIYTLAQLLAWRYMLWLSMTWRGRYFTQSHLAWSLALHLFCSVRRSLYGGRKEINTHTHTHTHTHKHTHTRMYHFTEKIESYEKANFSEMSEAQSFHKTSSWMLLN